MTCIRIASACTLVALLAACRTTPTPPPAPAATATTQPAAPAPTAAANTGRAAAPAASASPIPAHLDPRNPIAAERSVFFDYDHFSVKRDYFTLIERHGRYLAANPSLRIKIEGNADDRGSAEYNLALGQKRAHAVLAALRIQGARDAQMEATSWGEERPRNTADDETAWAENRRADVVYPR
jgi:peptidoglycan-associated lipoprotein